MPLNGFDHAITWGQFQTRTARPADAGDEDAEIRTGSATTYGWRERNGVVSVTSVTTSVTVNRELSWVVRGQATDALLRHEQGHYDIQALGARETHRRISELTASSSAELEREKRAIEREVQQKVDEKNTRYDDQTNHSRNAAQQRNWEGSIRRAKENATGTLDLLP